MTAQPTNHEDQQPVDDQIDPIGPITFTKRSRIGARAFALVGTASVFAVGVIELADTCTTHTSISAPH